MGHFLNYFNQRRYHRKHLNFKLNFNFIAQMWRTLSGRDITEIASNFNSPYNWEQEKQVLSILNADDPALLAMYSIPKKRIHDIQLHRRKYGNFDKIAQTLEVDGFAEKLLFRLCIAILAEDSFLPENKKTYKSNKRKVKITSPALSEEKRKTLSTWVAVTVNAEELAYAHLHKNGTLLNWHIIPLTGKHADSATKFEAVVTATTLLPQADCFVMGERHFSLDKHKPHLAQLNMSLVCLEAMLVSILSSVFLCSFQTVNLHSYRLYGDVPYATIMQQLFSVESTTVLSCPVIIQRNLQANYNSMSDGRLMADALLLALTFRDLAVQQRGDNDE